MDEWQLLADALRALADVRRRQDKWQLLADALRALADVRRRQAELTRRIEAIRVMDGIGREVELARLEAEIDAEIDAQSTEITGWILLLESELTRDDREIH